MRNLIIVGMTVSVALVAAPRADAAAWCRIARDLGGIDCSFNTFAQCAMSTERLNGGGCIQNPGYGSASAAPAAVSVERGGVIHHHRKSHRQVANR